MSYIINIPTVTPTPPTPPGGNAGDIQFNAGGGNFGGETLVPLSHGGTNADLSGTGGAHFVLRQSTVGGAITVSQLDYSDLSGTPTINTWAGLTGTLTNGQVIPYADAGISRLGAASLAIGNGTAGDFAGSLKLATMELNTAGAVFPQLAITSTSAAGTGRATFAVTNDIGTQFGIEVFGSNWAYDSLNNGVFIYAASGSTPAPFLRFVSSGELSSGGTTPIQFAAGGYGVTPQLSILPTGALQIGGADTSISRLGAASLAIGNGTAGDATGNLYLGKMVSSINESGYPTIAGFTNTSSTGVARLSLVNNHGATFYVQVTGSDGSMAPYSNAVSIGSYGGESMLNFGTNGDTPTGGTAPITFIAGGYSNVPSLAVLPTGSLTVGGPVVIANRAPLQFGTASTAGDSGISRLGAASLAVGNGTAGDTTGKLTLAHMNLNALAVYLTNALAITGGLVAGDLYRTGSDPDVVCIVH